ncbi:MAG: peptidoglycan DD-metalloendopeptidase family protein [Candidatus Eremiobacteraeota bacterium]|nr:peptidoglycan DD-metalloendopeptidase family protein [Candidatus Eremiobacteraeota bacterium]
MIKQRYFIKVVPQRGNTVHRFELTRRNIVIAGSALASILVFVLGFFIIQASRAHSQVAALQSIANTQAEQLKTIDQQTAAIRSQLLRVQRQNQEIQQLMGVKPKPKPAVQKTSWEARGSNRNALVSVVRHVDILAADSARTVAESNALRSLTMHVLNVRHLQDMARARMLASIPSIDPVDGAAVIGCFCYRTSPDAEFHPGVDLGADYGQTVRASAAGTVASADWDGGYGMKVDIDHGNGYHTWYAHLSRIDVKVGQFVRKGENIALVGSTGFSTGPHLHYQVMLNGKAIDPAPYLNGVPSQVLASLP